MNPISRYALKSFSSEIKKIVFTYFTLISKYKHYTHTHHSTFFDFLHLGDFHRHTAKYLPLYRNTC